MPAPVVKTAEQERLWRKAKKLAEEQGRAGQYDYIMGIFKQMRGMEKAGSMPGIAKPGQDRLWEVAKRKARQAGRERDYDYVMQLYREMTGWKSQAMEKSYLVPQKVLAHMRFQGQVPIPENIEAIRLAKEKPKPMSVARIMAHDEPRIKVSSIVKDLGMDIATQNDWTNFLETVVVSAPDEISLRNDVVSKCMNERMNAALRMAILQRAVRHWKEYRKSMIHIVKPEELLEKAEARGGKYHKRVPREKGGYTYYYDEEKYKASKRAHTSGDEASTTYISNRIQKCLEMAGKAGCGPDSFSDLVKKYGAKKVATVLKEGTGKKYSFEKGKFFLQKTDKKIAGKPEPKKVMKEPVSLPKEKIKKSEQFTLEKAGPHKYISKKRDSKGNWVYTYEDKTKVGGKESFTIRRKDLERIVPAIRDYLQSGRGISIAQVARSFRIEKRAAIEIIRGLEEGGAIKKDGDKYYHVRSRSDYISKETKKDLARLKKEREAEKKKPEPKLVIPKEDKKKLVPGEQLGLFQKPVKPEERILTMDEEKTTEEKVEDSQKQKENQEKEQTKEEPTPVKTESEGNWDDMDWLEYEYERVHEAMADVEDTDEMLRLRARFDKVKNAISALKKFKKEPKQKPVPKEIVEDSKPEQKADKEYKFTIPAKTIQKLESKVDHQPYSAGDVLAGNAPYGPGDSMSADHDSQENAYIIDDYPYGRQRTEKRVWVETNKNGQRMVSQTKHPYKGHWNKPKYSNYYDMLSLKMDEKGHVTYGIADMTYAKEGLAKFKEEHPDTYAKLSKNQQIQINSIIKFQQNRDAGMSFEEARQTMLKEHVQTLKQEGLPETWKKQKEAKQKQQKEKFKEEPIGEAPVVSAKLKELGLLSISDAAKMDTVADIKGHLAEYGRSDYFGARSIANAYKRLAKQATETKHHRLATQYKHLASVLDNLGGHGLPRKQAVNALDKLKKHVAKHGTVDE